MSMYFEPTFRWFHLSILRDFNDHLQLLGRHLEWDYHDALSMST
jgi:hypothetical protein